MKILAVLVFNLTFIVVLSAISSVQKTKIESFIQAVMECRQIPGLSFAVVKGAESWTKGFGSADREKEISVSTDSMFGIGSVTKAFTTTLLAMLLDDTKGRLTWTSKVSDILGPDFAFVDEERTRELTLRDLLAHRTGLARNDLLLFAGLPHNFTRAEFARRFRFLPEETPFRDVYGYNNYAYGLAGYIVEVLSGTSYEETLKKRILQPLGMTNTKVLGKTITTDDDMVAKPYFLVENQLVRTKSSLYDIHPVESAGSMASSADDMAKWMHFLLREGKTAGNKSLVSADILRETMRVQEGLPNSIIEQSRFTPTYPVAYVHFGYGYGWKISTYRGYRMFWHSGNLISYVTYLYFYPDLDLAIYTSTNGPAIKRTGRGQQVINFYTLDVLMGHEEWLNQATGCTFPLPWQKERSRTQNNSDVTNTPPECPECFTGVYGHQLYGDLEVKVEQGSLMLHYGRMKGSLNSTDEETKFKWDIGEPHRWLSRPGNDTDLVPVVFGEKESWKYQTVDLSFPHRMTFSQKIRFSDGIVTSDQESIHTSVKFIYILLVKIGMDFCRG